VAGFANNFDGASEDVFLARSDSGMLIAQEDIWGSHRTWCVEGLRMR
jgi:hypothetical protein